MKLGAFARMPGHGIEYPRLVLIEYMHNDCAGSARSFDRVSHCVPNVFREWLQTKFRRKKAPVFRETVDIGVRQVSWSIRLRLLAEFLPIKGLDAAVLCGDVAQIRFGIAVIFETSGKLQENLREIP